MNVNGTHLNIAWLKVLRADFCGEPILVSTMSANRVKELSLFSLSSSSSSSSLFFILSSRSESLDKALRSEFSTLLVSLLESDMISPCGISEKILSL